MTTDTSEKGLESLIVRAMTGRTDLLSPPFVSGPAGAPVAGGTGWLLGDAAPYDREHCVDLVQLRGFIAAAQPKLVEALSLETEGPTRLKFLARLQGEISKRGTIDVLRHGIEHGARTVALFYGTPTPGNAKAVERHANNRFSVTRQLRYSRDQKALALDLALFINGLPVFTFELKNSLTKQTVADAIEQYRRDRDPREKLVPAVRSRVERRSRQSAEPRGPRDGLPVEAHPHAGGAHRHSRELRAGRGHQGSEDEEGEAHPDLPTLSPDRRREEAARGRAGSWCRPALPHPALGRERQVELDRLAGASADRPESRGQAGLRVDHRGDGPAHPRQADPGHHQAVRAGRGDGRARGALGRPAQVHRRREEDHHLDDPEVPVHPRRDRQRAPRAGLRHPHRRSPRTRATSRSRRRRRPRHWRRSARS